MSDLATASAYSLASAPQTASENSTTTTSEATLSSDFETFLKMLTAQARYQDPLEPLDSSEYAAQLAQFSMVEQQVLTNENLGILQAQVAMTNMELLSGMIGLEARSYAGAYFDGAPITITPNPAAAADTVYLVVYDADGTEVDRQSLPVSAEPVDWDGTNSNGDTLPDGHYTFNVESWAEDEELLDEPAASYSEIEEAQSLNGQTVVVLKGGMAIATGAITGLRKPSDGEVAPPETPTTPPTAEPSEV
ncbi:flagellar hook capping FlgD N-terminal domain-containing protein [Marinibacterium sp. SX1]|uniref:flagellar hook capping FlgD N-terminal domain-containing protein n=1 Tax=Marinibacterium sp. SX1 TaxID=3388424 RepID=UPI003D1798BE